MKINEIEYQKNYNIIGMQWEKIIARGTMEDGDNFQDCVKKLRSECDQSAQEKINSLYQEQETTYGISHYTQPHDGTTQDLTIPQTQEEKITRLIQKATSLPELEQWKLLSNNQKYPQLKELYQQKLKELTNE